MASDAYDSKGSTVVPIPLRALLTTLPQELRGEAWDATGMPETSFLIDASTLLPQLQAGKVTVPLRDCYDAIPQGWARPELDVEIELDLALVVAAVPRELLELRAPEADDVSRSATIGDLFGAADRAVAPPSPPPAPPIAPPQPSRPIILSPVEPESSPVALGEPPSEPAPAPPVTPSQPNAGRDAIDLPVSLVLAALPEEFRGPSWQATAFPAGTFQIGREEALATLRAGRAEVQLSAVSASIPSGWVAQDAEGGVTLDLAQVVAAVPPEWLMVKKELADDAREAEAIRNVFAPTAAEAGPVPAPVAEPSAPDSAAEPEPVEAVVAPETATVVPPAEPLSPPPPREGWDGVTRSLEYAAKGVDINHASVPDLVTIKGVGESRAQGIVSFRKAHGPFPSVFGLARVPGIGRHLFREMTGFSLQSKVDPYAALLTALKVERDERPLLTQIVQALGEQLPVKGCLLSDRQGLAIGATGSLVAKAGDYAALGAHLILRSERMLRRFAGEGTDAMVLPGGTGTLLVVRCEDTALVAEMEISTVSQKTLRVARKALAKVAWLLGTRAVVTAD